METTNPSEPAPLKQRKAGRRSRAEEIGIQQQLDELELPPIGDTEDAVRDYVAAVARAVAHGLIPAGTARELNSAASISLRAIRQRKSGEELDRWESLMAREESLEKRNEGRMARTRQRRTKKK